MDKKTYKIGLLGAGGKLEINNNFLSYSHPYGKTFKVLVSDIETVVISPKGFGNSILKVIGKGAELAAVDMPTSWADKCQEWILSNK